MYTVMVIDDKEVFRRKIKRMGYFQDNSDKFEIRFEAQNGLEALDTLRSNRVDVVLTDIRMPFIDGIELLKIISAESLCKCVILLSEFAEFSYAKAGILGGAFDYLLKPIDDDMIKETFDRAYNYLATINGSDTTEARRLESLAEFILSGDQINALAYANYIESRLKVEDEHYLILAGDTLRQLVGFILQKSPHLKDYVNFGSLCVLDTVDGAPNNIVSPYAKRILDIAGAIDPFIVRTKNDLVARMCHMVLECGGVRGLGDIAGSLYVNPKHLGAMMKKETEKSFVEYSTFVRMARARLLLSEPSAKVYEVARALGYDDVDYFSRVFKKETGETPSAYRERGAL